jgi:hypothetical protein
LRHPLHLPVFDLKLELLMPRRTSVYEVLAKYWVVAFLLALPIGIPAVLVGAISLPFLALIALVAILLFNGIQWIAHRVIFWGLFGETDEYQKFRASGGDPWFDVGCPPPFNSDSEQVRLTGSESETQWLCRNCGADMADPHAPCPVCEYGRWACGRCGALVRGQFHRCSKCGNHPKAKRGTP